MKKLGWLAAGLVLTTGCASVVATRSGPAYRHHDEDCHLEVFMTMPPGYAEIGVVDVTTAALSRCPETAVEFRDRVAHDVCAMGGDALLLHTTEWHIHHAAVLRKVSAPVATPAAAPRAATSTCRYDSDCEGDGLCVRGRCADPEK